jgi:glycosyltransferase involved in cell wall biosynthesis
VGARVPYPVRDGGNARGYRYLRELARRHEVSYLCRAEAPGPEAEAHLRALCASAELVVDPLDLGWPNRLAAVARGVPFGVIAPRERFFRRVTGALAAGPFDLVHLAGVDTALLAERARATHPVAWDLGDCTSRYYARQWRAEGRPARRLWYRLQAARYRRLERRLLRQDLAVLVASPSEAAALGPRPQWWPSRVETLAHGVDEVPPLVPAPGPPRVAFTGTLGYPPNRDALLYLCRDIVPALAREHPDLRVDVVGPGASAELVAACGSAPRVRFHGFVPDVFAVLRRATVFACPMRLGTGVKVKLLEAMACGLPAVATPVAVEGLPEARDGWNLLVASSPDAFVAGVSRLLRDEALRRRLGQRARETLGRYRWERLGDRLDQVCRDEVARRRGPRR